MTCSPSPFTLQPAQSGTCTFTSAGTFSYSDPASTALQGSLTVSQPAPPATLTLFAQPDTAIYASKVTLTGELSTKKAGENIVVLATPCGRSEATKAATMQTTSGGEYTIDLRPGRNTVYTVQAGATKSEPVTVKVRPRLRLGRVGAHRYSLRVFAAQKFAGRYATFQRYNAGSGRWVFVKRVRLHANSTNILPTVISSVAFRSAIAPRHEDPRRPAAAPGGQLLPARHQQRDPQLTGDLAPVAGRCGTARPPTSARGLMRGPHDDFGIRVPIGRTLRRSCTSPPPTRTARIQQSEDVAAGRRDRARRRTASWGGATRSRRCSEWAEWRRSCWLAIPLSAGGSP